ncbi:YggS family pyridoxal phosphate-dependent enzyme [Flagellimonas sp. DF-77]|uniref:YggS family pyridoxal phosphate-dependent enzyme n=1 Tax=Flagellimonas algarum TaxID=3230298 RepID=UPI00339A9F53
MDIASAIERLNSELGQGVTLVAVSKTKPVADIMEAYEAGQRIFGENKIQEMTAKWEQMPKDIVWHMIGHVQRNKVKYMAPFVALIHGVDSLRLLQEIDKQAKKHDRTIDCLLQLHIAEESSKFGFNEAELSEMIASDTFKTLDHVSIKGVMGMATFTDDQEQVRREFRHLKQVFDNLKTKLPGIGILSMGMSGDYTLAIAEGSNMVRIGSSIFGARQYPQPD